MPGHDDSVPARSTDTHLHFHPNIRGSLFMAAAMAAFTINDTITKAVASEMNIGQIILVRGAFAFVLIAALASWRGAVRPVRTLLIRPVGMRVIGEIGGTLTFLSAIAHMPLANAAAIFQALPLVITLGAAVIFGEPVGWRRWLAIAAGFVGVLVIVRPGMAGFNQVALLALAAVLLLIGYQCVITSLRTGDISAIAPFRYTALPWAMLLGYLAFGDKPDWPMVIGAVIIVLSGLYAFYRERVRNRLRPAASASGLPPEGV